MHIPVWHDDQQGTATVLLAALMNALELQGKRLADVRIALIGMGAANVAAYRLLTAAGVDAGNIVGCDTGGTLHRGRLDIEEQSGLYVDKWRVCRESNAGAVVGGIKEALRGADVLVAFSRPQPGLIRAEWVRDMAPRPIVFACANPEPEIWPWDARSAGAAIVATGRSDFPNQLNNALAFPGILRGVLDVRARTVSDEMAIAAAREIADCARNPDLGEETILPRIDDPEVAVRVAVATAMTARRQSLASLAKEAATVRDEARATIARARAATAALLREGVIPAPPERPGSPTHEGLSAKAESS
jgi:malate dehydrogenase (oxaloacetate-decarboxylating)